MTHWIETHRICIGIFTDTLTFLGGSILARDAFRRLRELKSKRINEQFHREFPRLNLTDEEWKAGVAAMKWTLAGFVLMSLGFLCQLLLRFIEAR